mgnify:CR=1 FL=1
MENEHEIELPASDAAAVSGEPPTLEREPVAAAVAAPSAPAFADGTARQLEPGWIDVSRVGGLITFSVLGVGAFLVLGVVALTGKIPFPLFAVITFALLALVGLVLLLAALWPKWEHARAGYRFLPDRIECWNGLVWRRSISVPVSRVQYTDVKQGPVQRKYAIATLVVHTAGTLGSDIEFPGLPPQLANEVRDWLVGETGSDAV